MAIAGVIAMKPEILILDEPTAGLNPWAHADILNKMCIRDSYLYKYAEQSLYFF